MKAYRTPWWYFVLGCIAGLALGAMSVSVTESSSLVIAGAPWIALVVLVFIGIVTLVLALQTHQYATAKPKDRKMPNHARSVIALMLSKSLGMASAILMGWYLGQIFMSISHIDIVVYGNVVRECAIAAFVCFLDMIVGIVGEWLCQIPPEDRGESTNDSQRASASIS
ncbi:DUF3180 domain-containing protein [Gardnerella vaginalis]|uniref:DUF3180 domain-containing protein n=1 Tax=Gardnerella vaginalis TaxID=2702 RepID=A0A2K1SUA6_GARVA|nr:DUF3180 domain-containing protein [Gardnerella vaginalis]PNS43076.1 DUF3180 domain-containing protein [Gardnerella vaginalis]